MERSWEEGGTCEVENVDDGEQQGREGAASTSAFQVVPLV